MGPASFLLSTAGALISPYATVAVSAVVIVYFIVGPGAPAAMTQLEGPEQPKAYHTLHG